MQQGYPELLRIEILPFLQTSERGDNLSSVAALDAHIYRFRIDYIKGNLIRPDDSCLHTLPACLRLF